MPNVFNPKLTSGLYLCFFPVCNFLEIDTCLVTQMYTKHAHTSACALTHKCMHPHTHSSITFQSITLLFVIGCKMPTPGSLFKIDSKNNIITLNPVKDPHKTVYMTQQTLNVNFQSNAYTNNYVHIIKYEVTFKHGSNIANN